LSLPFTSNGLAMIKTDSNFKMYFSFQNHTLIIPNQQKYINSTQKRYLVHMHTRKIMHLSCDFPLKQQK
jgi:hypothetical protein